MVQIVQTTPNGFASFHIMSTTLRTADAINRGVKRAAYESRRVAIKQINDTRPYPPVSTGEMRKSYMISELPWGWMLSNMANHAGKVEFGSKPHTPPFKDILAWAERVIRRRGKRSKGDSDGAGRTHRERKRRSFGQGDGMSGAGDRMGKGRKGRPLKGKSKTEARRFAGAVWKAIQRRGTAPRRFHAIASKSFGSITRDKIMDELLKVKHTGWSFD